MDGREGSPSYKEKLLSGTEGSTAAPLPWGRLSPELELPGRSQQGQLLSIDDEPSTDTDSDTQPELQRRRHAEGGLTENVRLDDELPGVRETLTSAAAVTQMQQPRTGASNGGDESGTDTDEDGELIRAKARAAQEVPKTFRRKQAGKTRAGAGITLGLLIREGILWPGTDVLSVEYKSVMTYATLTSDGQIVCHINGGDITFESPSAFSIFLKRMVNPNRKADDGWKTVKFNGKFLETYKLELAKRRLAATSEDPNTGSELGPLAKKPKLEAGKTLGSHPRKARLTTKLANGHGSAPSAPELKPLSQCGSNLEDEAQMIPCERYRGEPGSSSSGAQPFRVEVSTGAALFMDFHAHLSTNEIVGLLAGTWQPEQRLLRIERAFPVRESRGQADVAAVIMDVKDESRVTQAITEQFGMRVVGWYHSHPHAATHPSTPDILRQVALQKQHREAGSTEEPFVGAIVGPYSAGADSARSRLTYYRVDYPQDRELLTGIDPIAEGCLPMEIEVDEVSRPATENYIANMPQNEMRAAAHCCASSTRRADIHSVWRGPSSKLEKIKAALSTRLPQQWATKRVEQYLLKADAVVVAAWNFFTQQRSSRHTRHDEDELEISDVTQGHETHSPAALADDADGGEVDLAEDQNGHGSHVDRSTSGLPPFQQLGEEHRDSLHEPAVHSYFDNGTTMGSGHLDGGYDDTLLDGHLQNRGCLGYGEDGDGDGISN